MPGYTGPAVTATIFGLHLNTLRPARQSVARGQVLVPARLDRVAGLRVRLPDTYSSWDSVLVACRTAFPNLKSSGGLLNGKLRGKGKGGTPSPGKPEDPLLLPYPQIPPKELKRVDRLGSGSV